MCHDGRKFTHSTELRGLYQLLLNPLDLQEYAGQLIGSSALRRLGGCCAVKRGFGSPIGGPQFSQSCHEHCGDQHKADRQHCIDEPAIQAKGIPDGKDGARHEQARRDQNDALNPGFDE
jgi:hypothetical protein